MAAVCGASIIIVKQVKSFSGFSSFSPLRVCSTAPRHLARPTLLPALFVYKGFSFDFFFLFFYSPFPRILFIYIRIYGKVGVCNKFMYRHTVASSSRAYMPTRRRSIYLRGVGGKKKNFVRFLHYSLFFFYIIYKRFPYHIFELLSPYVDTHIIRAYNCFIITIIHNVRKYY